MSDLSLFDPLTPYFFAGVDLGAGVNDILALLHVDEFDAAWDEDGVVLWGVARIDSDDPNSFFFSPHSGGGPIARNGNNQPMPDAEVWEWHDLSVRFRLTVSRQAAAVLVATDITDTSLRTLLQALGNTTPGSRSDYPGTQFRLELLLNLVTITLPKLRGAKLEPNGLLVDDPTRPRVKLKLPRILLIITQGSTGPDTPFQVDVGSFGASGFDGQSQEILDLIEMDPPYALVGTENVFGFGFRKLIIDLDDSQSPPELLDKFGVGEDWQGVYLPEVRIFIAPSGMTGFAVSAGVREMLIGIRNTPGVWGDFMVDVINQGDRLVVEPRLYDAQRRELPGGLWDTDDANKRDEWVFGSVPDEASLLIDIRRGAAPYTIKALFGRSPSDGIPTDADFDAGLDLSVSQHHNVSAIRQVVAVRVTTRNPSQRRVLLIDLFPRSSAEEQRLNPGPTNQRASLNTVGMPPAHDVRLENADQEQVTLVFTPAEGAQLQVNGQPETVVDGRAVVRVPMSGTNTPIPLAFTWTVAGTREPHRFNAYFELDHPERNESGVVIKDAPGPSGSDIASSTALNDFLSRRPNGTAVRVDGFASFESDNNLDHDSALSLRRANELAAYLRTRVGGDTVTVNSFGHDRHPLTDTPALSTELQAQVRDSNADLNQSGKATVQARGDSTAIRSLHWRAMASYTRDVSSPSLTASGTLRRGNPIPAPPQPPRDVPPVQAQRPDFLREIGATVRILQSEFVALEVRGKVDFHTASERGLEQFRGTPQPGVEIPDRPIPERTNPEDGVVDFRLNISHDDTTNTWTERLQVQAGAGDRDGLFALGSIPTANVAQPPPESISVGKDLLGFYFAIAPLAAAVARPEPDAGDIVALTATLAAPLLVTSLGIAHVLQFTLYGVEASLKHHGAFEDGKFAMLFDVESAIWLNFKLGDTFRIITCRPDKPIRLRYKAVGFTINAGFDNSGPFVPVFDASRGYTIDLADSGSLKVLPDLPGPLGDIIQIMGARIARTNPLNLEVEMGLAVDLGVFKLDKFGFRLPIDPLGAPTLTALGVSVDIPNTLVGKGRLEIKETGFAGQVDVSLPSVKLRIAAGLAISSLQDSVTGRTATGLYLSLRIELPTGIPLAGTGLGIFGFLGLFAMHYARLEPTTGNDRALRWLKDVVQGDPTDIRGWGPSLDKWAFGAGILLGTLEGAYVVRMTGMFALELPGPRLLFFLRADLLNTSPPKGVKNESGTLLAALDIDFGAGTICVGIQLDYKIDPILQLTVPVEGFFDINNPSHFYIDIGSIARPITAKVLEVFKATAYLMMHGDGIPDFPLGALQGFSVAVGFHVSLEWGVKEINLYLEVAAGFDAGIGFAPFFIAGRVYLRGALHLFIISIEARGELQAQTDGADTWLFGSVCGSIDLFFFEIEGCVSFELGTKPGTPHAPSLVRGLALQSRSPALVRGTGLDRGIDTVLVRGTTDGSVPQAEDEKGVLRPTFVPIDAIPIVQFEVAPELASGFSIVGELVGALPGGDQGWRKRGELLVRYRITSVQLTSPGLSNPVGPGERPNTWRQVLGERTGDAPPIDLALLDWSPDATPKAFESSESRDETVEDRYENLCEPVAPAAPVMWTFHRTAAGESPVGWQLEGEPWPDPDGSHRSIGVATGLKVIETWRTGGLFEAMRAVVPARVVGTFVPCPPKRDGTKQPRPLRPTKRIALARVPKKLVEFDAAQANEQLIDTIAAQDLLIERTTLIKPSSELREAIGSKLLGKSPTPELEAAAPSQRESAKIQPSVAAAAAAAGKIPVRIPGAAGKIPLKPIEQPLIEQPIETPKKPPIGQPKQPPIETPIETPKQPPVEQPKQLSRLAQMREAIALLKPPDKRGCASRVLVAPFEHLGADRAPTGLFKELEQLILEMQHKQLSDVVRFEGGPLLSFRMLALLRGKMAASGLYGAQAFDAAGQPVGVELNITIISNFAQLPATWRDTAGPWFEEVFLSAALFQLAPQSQDWNIALCEFKLAGPARAIEFGIRPLTTAIQKFGLVYPAYLVAAMEGLAEAEVQRASDDQTEATDDAEGLADGLAADSAARALLVPNRRYDVTVHYVAEVGERNDDGTVHVLRGEESFSQTHTFFTDAEPPKRLEPWLLCQFPSPDERHHFYDDPIILVFGTDDLTQLFAAYGRDLRGAVRDASFRPPANNTSLVTKKLLAGAVMQKLGGVVFSPWEQAVRRLLGDKPCGDFNPNSPRHERAVLDLHMEPLSEYVFDVEAPRKSDGVVPPPAPNTIVQPLHRQNLATSRYANREAMAADLRESYIANRRVPTPAPLLSLAEISPDEAFDKALVDSGLGVSPRPTSPHVTILWNDSTPPTPVAILLDTPEPLWRMRLEPEAQRDSTGRVIAWELVQKLWLGVEELVPSGGGVPGQHKIITMPFVRRSTGVRTKAAPTIIELRDLALNPPLPVTPPPIPAVGSQVQRFVRDSSGCRTLIVLGPNARGRTVSLGLVRNLHPLIDPDAVDDPVPMLDVFLQRAPWEVSP